jgi:phosphoribosylamine-glycine ligase
MKYVIFTFSGEGLALADQLQREGQDVTVAQINDLKKICLKEELKGLDPEPPEKKKARLSMFDGVIKKHDADQVIAALKKVKKTEEYFIFFDFNHCFQYAEQISGMGFHGNFPTEADRRFETDRDAAKDFVKKNYTGVKIGEKHEFKTIDEGKAFLEETDELWVLKPFDDNSDAKTKVPDATDPEQASKELITALDAHKEGFESQGYVMELMIPDAIEITPQRIYYNGKPIYTSCDIELKRLGSGIGPMTGCTADLVFQIADDSKLAKVAFPEIVEAMAKKHKGMFVWDISILCNPHNGKLYMGEFCPNRVGYNAFYTETSLAWAVSDYFEDLVAGVNPLEGAKQFAASVRMFLIREGGVKEDVGITVDREALDDIWFVDMKKGESGIMTAGYIWDVCIATGQGDTIEKAAENAYHHSEAVQFDNKYQRQMFDFLSEEPDSLVKRYDYGKEAKLY